MSVYESSIDDNDSSVFYSDGWILVTSDPPWSGTMHSTSIIGSTLRVRFTGSAVAVICTIPTGGEGQRSMATFSIDGSSPVFVTHLTTPPVQFQYNFWSADSLPLGSHLLEIKNVGNEAYLRVDRIDYDPTDSHAPKISAAAKQQNTPAAPVVVQPPAQIVTSVISIIGGSPTIMVVTADNTNFSKPTSLSTITNTNAPLPTLEVPGLSRVLISTEMVSITADVTGSSALGQPTNVASNNDTTSAKSSDSTIAATVGGVLGGLLFLALLVAAFVFLRRRQRKNQRLAGPHYPEARDVAYRPHAAQRTEVASPFSLAHSSSTSQFVPLRHEKSGGFGFDVTPNPSVPPSPSPYGGSSNTSMSDGISVLQHPATTPRGFPDTEAPPPAYPGPHS